MDKLWICSTDESQKLNETNADLFYPKCSSFRSILIEIKK